jgi:hypothetical protein
MSTQLCLIDEFTCTFCQAWHTCSFWSDQLQNWSSEGCEFLESSNNLTFCRCTHLTSFISLITPPLTLPTYSIKEAFTWENLCKYPTGLIIIGAFSIIFAVSICFGSKDSLGKDLMGITWTYRYLCSMLDTEDIGSSAIIIAEESKSKTIIAEFWKKVELEHSWISIVTFHPCEMSREDRIVMLYTGILSGAAVGTMS